MSHECPECGQTCYCDMEDHDQEAPDDCSHECPPEDDDDGYEEPPRCSKTKVVKLPHDSVPSTIRLQCVLDEDHDDECEFDED